MNNKRPSAKKLLFPQLTWSSPVAITMAITMALCCGRAVHSSVAQNPNTTQAHR